MRLALSAFKIAGLKSDLLILMRLENRFGLCYACSSQDLLIQRGH